MKTTHLDVHFTAHGSLDITLTEDLKAACFAYNVAYDAHSAAVDALDAARCAYDVAFAAARLKGESK